MTALGQRYRPSTSVKDWLPQPASTTYVRPSDWLALPSVISTDQKFVGLHAVYNNESNFAAVNCAGAYTVDWGDGSAPVNVATGVSAYHNYVYSDLGAGTLSTRGYRQAVVTITPQGGSNLTKVDLYTKHNQSGLADGYSSGWLDIRMAGSLLTTLTIGSAVTTVLHRLLEQFEFVGTNGVTSFASLFASCAALRSLVALYTALGTDFTSMFNGCRCLATVPLLNTGAGTNFTSMFNTCVALQTVPLLNTAAGVTFTSMFATCTALATVPLLNTAAGVTFTSMFNGCNSLQTVPLLNMAAGTALLSMFTACTSLRSGTLSGTSSTISYASCCLGPTALDAIYTALAAMNLLSANAASCETNVTDWSTGPVNCAVSQSTVTGGSGTKAARLTSTAAGTTSAAITSRLAVSASSPYTFLATVKSSVARSCSVNVAWYDAGGALLSTDVGASVTSSTSVWTQLSVSATSPVGAVTASVILVAVATAGAETHDFDKMGLFYGLGVTQWVAGGTAPTITVSNNWGVASDTPSIATNKGWTVTGS